MTDTCRICAQPYEWRATSTSPCGDTLEHLACQCGSTIRSTPPDRPTKPPEACDPSTDGEGVLTGLGGQLMQPQGYDTNVIPDEWEGRSEEGDRVRAASDPRARLRYARAIIGNAVRDYRLMYGVDAGEELRFALEGAAQRDRSEHEARKRAARGR